MISVEKAKALVRQHQVDLAIETIDFKASLNRILAEDIIADRDFPPFNRVAMDGIAIAHAAFAKGQRSFGISGTQFAGSPQLSLDSEEGCMEVMTGAMLPAGTDTVIRYEDIVVADGSATIQVDNISRGQNVHAQGSDAAIGDIVLPKGKKIESTDISILATVGKSELAVKKLPTVVVVSTGDELVDVSETPAPYQIRKSNTYTLLAELKKLGIDGEERHIVDDKDTLMKEISLLLESFDVLIFSGGVSRGKKDFLPEVLDQLGVEKQFHKIAQRPGKPMWFGTHPKGGVVFGFPGNPVSVFVCFKLYFESWLYASLGHEPLKIYASLQEDVSFKPPLSYHMAVTTSYQGNNLLAYPVSSGGSGDLMTLGKMNGFVTLPEGRDLYKKGELFELVI